MPLIEIEEDHLVTQVGDIVPAEMDDDDLLDCMAMLCVEGADIREQIANPVRASDVDWAFRARDALRYRVRDFEACRIEAIRRGLRDLPDINPEREQRRLNRVAEWERQRVAIAAREVAMYRKAELAATGQLPGQIKHLAEVERAKADRAAREVERAEKHRLAMLASASAFSGKAALFVAAARELMTVEQRREIWERAREMHPNDPCWEDQRRGDAA